MRVMPVNTRNSVAEAMLPNWTAVRDFLAGTGAVKARETTYLPRLPGQRTISKDGHIIDEYRNYVQRAVVQPYATRVLNGLTGLLNRKKTPRVSPPPRRAPR